jgi:polar amino acid transport system substrate-binding protein
MTARAATRVAVRLRPAWLVAGLLLACAACAPYGAATGGAVASPRPSPASSPSPAATAGGPCGDPAASLRPQGALPAPGVFPAGSFMRTIHDRGRLVVGVARDSFLFSYPNQDTKQLEGFDVDVARQVARALFGDENRIELRPITAAQRAPALQDGSVDLVARLFGITCADRRQVEFSTVYYASGQRVLVARTSTAQGLQDMGGKRVCAVSGSPAADTVSRAASHPTPVTVRDYTDCLVMLAMGRADGVVCEEPLLVGLAAQDQSVKVVGARLTTDMYGLGVSQAHPEFVRYANAVLERMRADGTWSAAYNRWLAREAGPASPPPATYRD